MSHIHINNNINYGNNSKKHVLNALIIPGTVSSTFVLGSAILGLTLLSSSGHILIQF